MQPRHTPGAGAVRRKHLPRPREEGAIDKQLEALVGIVLDCPSSARFISAMQPARIIVTLRGSRANQSCVTDAQKSFCNDICHDRTRISDCEPARRLSESEIASVRSASAAARG